MDTRAQFGWLHNSLGNVPTDVTLIRSMEEPSDKIEMDMDAIP